MNRIITDLIRPAFCLLCSVSCVTHMSGQNRLWDVPRSGGETITEPSPEATAMRRYQDFPVSYASGTADISIPLVDLPGGTVGVSLGISYHTGGIRKTELPTCIGLGWTLTGLGQVSRQIQGFPDEWKGSVTGQPIRFSVGTTPKNLDFYRDIANGKAECEYDIYNYSFPGYSGSFIIVLPDEYDKSGFGGDCYVHMLQNTGVTVKKIEDSSNPGSIDAFVITTPEGAVYRFDVKEKIRYSYHPNPIPVPNPDRNYEAVSSWHLSEIVGPEGADTVKITYKRQAEWEREQNSYMYSASLQYADLKLLCRAPASQGSDPSGRRVTRFIDHVIPYRITAGAGSIEFNVDTGDNNTVGRKPPGRISGMTLRDRNGSAVRSVSFGNSGKFGDSRRRLDKVEIRTGGVLTDSYSFTYNQTGSDDIDDTRTKYDLFGFPNSRSKGLIRNSILSTDFTVSDERRPNASYVADGSLTRVEDMAGAVTELEYEPSRITVSGNEFNPLNGEQIIGVRLKSVSTTDRVSGRRRKRSFEYADAVCSVDLSALNYGDFISSSGCSWIETVPLTMVTCPVFSPSSTLTASCTLRGYPLENATVYYRKVTESVSGTDMDKPVITEYRYDVDNCIMPLERAGGMPSRGTYSIGLTPDKLIPLNLSDNNYRLFEAHPTQGYFYRRIGGTPLLTSVKKYEYSKGTYRLVNEIVSHHSTIRNRIMCAIFCEPTTLRVQQYQGAMSPEIYIHSSNDINRFRIYMEGIRTHCDSTVTTTFYPDGNSRTVRTANRYSSEMIPTDVEMEYITPKDSVIKDQATLWRIAFPGYNADSISGYTSAPDYPLMSVTSCGGESVTRFDVRSEHTGKIFVVNLKRTLKTLPVIDRRIYRTQSGSDSLLLRYEYGRFYCGGRMLTRPTRVYVETDGEENSRTLISSQRYTAYDSRGRITGMVDAGGRRVTAGWMAGYDLLTELSMPDAGLTSRYTHTPMVGCTSIEGPSGRVRRFGYTGGRLADERNTAGETVASYTYQLYGDGSGGGKANRFTATVHDDRGEATTTTYYDGFGLPVQSVTPAAAGDNLVRSAVTYDALDRAVRQYRPVPAGDDTYSSSWHADAAGFYGDTRPFAEVTYRGMAGDAPLEVMREGELMQGHPERYGYLCNSTSEPLLRCRRYRLADSRDSESVTLDGDRPGGELDVVRTTDADGCELLTFTDWRGWKVLERRPVDATTFADTYYLYDPLGQLRVILQPEGVAAMNTLGKTWTIDDDEMERYAFVYRYDRRGNCTYSKVPGCGAVEMAYDPLNRLAFRSTATMRERGETGFYLYDCIGRSVVTGICYDEIPESIPVMTAHFDSDDDGLDGSHYVCDDAGLHGFLTDMILFDQSSSIVNYYDTYGFASCVDGFDRLTLSDLTLNGETAKGMLTGTRTGIYFDSMQRSSEKEGRYEYAVMDYDVEGRLTAQVETSASGGLSTYNTYNRQGQVTCADTRIDYSYVSYRLRIFSRYLSNGNLLKQMAKFSTIYPENNEVVSSSTYVIDYSYDDIGRLATTTHTDGRNGGFERRFSYNIHSAVKGISSPAVTQSLRYEDGKVQCYNGNVSEMELRYRNDGPVTRTFSYDRLDRLTAMTSSDGFDTEYAYDLNSNPIALVRMGLTSESEAGIIDFMDMTYEGNRLVKAVDYADEVLLENSSDFAAGESAYEYDSDGRLTADSGRGITYINYSHCGNPLSIEAGNSHVEYSYTADGRKRTRSHYMSGTSSGGITIKPIDTREYRYYSGPFEFSGQANKYILPPLDRVNTPWGYFDRHGDFYTYDADYQGNIRAVLDSVGDAVQTTDYYPYGQPMTTSTNAEVNRYKYSGKEFETEFGLNQYDFHARTHLPQLGLFTAPDPLAAQSTRFSPYLYCAANPMRYVDPTGMNWVERFHNGIREIFYDRDVTDQESLENASYYNDSKYTGVRMLEDGETITLGEYDYTFLNDLENNKYGLRVESHRLMDNSEIVQGKDFDIFGTSDDSCDAKSLHRNMLGTSYTGPKNPYTYKNEQQVSYQYKPRNMSEIASMAHDMAYDRAGASGIDGALYNKDVIGADIQFILYNRYAAKHSDTFIDRYRAAIAANVFSIIVFFKRL